MGVTSLSVDAVPSRTLTPQEPLVETLRVSLAADPVLVLSGPHDKPFLVTRLVNEWSPVIRSGQGSALLVVSSEEQCNLWAKFLDRITDLQVENLAADADFAADEEVGPEDEERPGSEAVPGPSKVGLATKKAVLVTTPEALEKTVDQNCSEAFPVSLLIIDNGHVLPAHGGHLPDGEQDCKEGSAVDCSDDGKSLVAICRKFLSRFSEKFSRNEDDEDAADKESDCPKKTVVFTANLMTTLDQDGPELVARMQNEFKSLESRYMGCRIEAASELLSLIRFFVDPSMCVVQCLSKALPVPSSDGSQSPASSIKMSEADQLELEVEKVVRQCRDFMADNRYSLLDMYGDEYADLIQEIPDPTELPLKLADEFLEVLKTMGLWCAERAATLLAIRLEKLRTCEKYEMNFLMFGALFTAMMAVRKMCNDAFKDMTELEKLMSHSKPKLLKVAEILHQYKPDHIQPGRHSGHKSSGGKKAANSTPTTASSRTSNSSPTLRRPQQVLHEDAEVREGDDATTLTANLDLVPEDGLAGGNLSDEHSDPEPEAEPEPKQTPPKVSSTVAPQQKQLQQSPGQIKDKGPVRPQGRQATHSRGGGSRGGRHRSQFHHQSQQYSSYDDPNALCGLIFVRTRFSAQVLYHFVKELAHCDEAFSFLTPQCTPAGAFEETEELLEGEQAERRKQEEALRRFRMKESNLLISNSLLEAGVDSVRCNLVLAYDPPDSFKAYIQHKVKAKAASSWYVILQDEEFGQASLGKSTELLLDNIALYKAAEGYLKRACTFQGPPSSYDALKELHDVVSSDTGKVETLGLHQCVMALNRYCARLPSDTFTRLTPLYDFFETSQGTFVCAIQLPINSPLKSVVAGKPVPTRDLAMRYAALEACRELQKIKELDDYLYPTGRDYFPSKRSNFNRFWTNGGQTNPAAVSTVDGHDEGQQQLNLTSKQSGVNADSQQQPVVCSLKEARAGTTKRRQYYYKEVADCLKIQQLPVPTKEQQPEVQPEQEVPTVKENPAEPMTPLHEECFYLYSLDLKLTCAIPDEQNTRGRRIFSPQDARQKFGMLVREKVPPVNEFPVYTRSGEVFVRIRLLKSGVSLNSATKELVQAFHTYTFDNVLRLVKYPMVFAPDSAPNSVLVVPLKAAADSDQRGSDDEIDWDFLRFIDGEKGRKLEPLSDEARKGFQFREDSFKDAVVMPWYRNQDQPQYFYVAEICEQLTPASAFPGQGFETFDEYYLSKYSIQIQNLHGQPLLDVDHTSARLNFLTPRYVNRKGVALRTTSEENKKNKRENLEQKQILVPELCAIHPFPASLWRQTVCLPCILYRLNGLLLADQLRSMVSSEVGIGRVYLDQDHLWPPLTFGWTLSDVLKNRPLETQGEQQPVNKSGKPDQDGKKKLDESTKVTPDRGDEGASSLTEDLETEENRPKNDNNKAKNGDLGCLTDQLLSKLSEEESRLKKQPVLEIGTWSNDMAVNQSEAKTSKRPKKTNGQEDEDDYLYEDDVYLDPNVALPDNLVFLDSSILPKPSQQGGRDWGTGIAQRQVRVGSPTFFSNPNINIPGLELYDSDTYSCSDDESVYDDDNNGKAPPQAEGPPESRKRNRPYWGDQPACVAEDQEDLGFVRIEFRGDNTAEAVEDEDAKKRRTENMARYLEEEARMVESLAWPVVAAQPSADLSDLSRIEAEVGSVRQKMLDSGICLVLTIEGDEKFDRRRHSTMHSSTTGGKEASSAHQKIILRTAAETKGMLDAQISKRIKAFEHKLMSPSMPIATITGKESSFAVESRPEGGLGVIERPDDQQFPFSFDYQPDLEKHSGPSPSLILQSLTMSNSNDAINLERLETVGDSFLKYATTSYLFCVNPSVHEGKLSHLRSRFVSNLNLYRLGQRKGFGRFMIATKFEPHDNWLPPCYHLPLDLEQALIQSGVPASHWNMADLQNIHSLNREDICKLVREKSGFVASESPAAALPGTSDQEQQQQQLQQQQQQQPQQQLRCKPWNHQKKLPTFVPYNLLTQHSVADKSIADCVEAQIGAYLIECGIPGALKYMKWLGLNLICSSSSSSKKVSDDDSSSICFDGYKDEQQCSSGRVSIFPQPSQPQLDDERLRVLDHMLSGYDKFEDLIGYRFSDRTYLLQAFSHASYYPNRLTDCYQRLEFLGDAVLDYLITRHLYEDPRQHSPGALTDLRSALVNNTIFASLAVKYEFHKYFKHYSPGLQVVINRFVKIQVENGHVIPEEGLFLLGEDENEEAEDVEVPKAMGDIFESVAGAIYLDCGMRLDPVWRVFHRMMKSEIEMYSNNVPKSPVRELLELEPETAKFGKPEKLADGRRVRVSVEVFGKGVFKGIGRNYRIAKCTAAKCALRAIKKRYPSVS